LPPGQVAFVLLVPCRQLSSKIIHVVPKILSNKELD
jgi:hypothetical protein